MGFNLTFYVSIRKTIGEVPELSDEDLWKEVTAEAWSRRVGFLLTDQAEPGTFDLPAQGSSVHTYIVHYYQVTEPQFWDGAYEYAVAETMGILNCVSNICILVHSLLCGVGISSPLGVMFCCTAN
jgi:hypothetical protein